MTVNFTGVLNTDFKGLLAGDEYIADIHLSDAELCLRTFALSGEIQSQTVLRACSIAVGRA